MIRLAETLDTALKAHIYAVLDAHKAGTPLPEIDCWTDSFGEMLDKLAVLHIRVWFCENDMGEAHILGDDAKIAEIKKKMDILWKRKRPSLVAAINRLVDDAVIHGKSLREESVKNYKGFNE